MREAPADGRQGSTKAPPNHWRLDRRPHAAFGQGLDDWAKAALEGRADLGFNLGIEAGQVAVSLCFLTAATRCGPWACRRAASCRWARRSPGAALLLVRRPGAFGGAITPF
jgi:hypothetical protein